MTRRTCSQATPITLRVRSLPTITLPERAPKVPPLLTEAKLWPASTMEASANLRLREALLWVMADCCQVQCLIRMLQDPSQAKA